MIAHKLQPAPAALARRTLTHPHRCCDDRSFIQVPFLNLMSLLTARAGRVTIRVGGNSQETASLVEVGSLAGGKAIEKDKDDTSNPVRVQSACTPCDVGL